MTQLVLASTSVYRKELLQRLQIKFETCSPDTDETILADETASDACKRLALEKAKAVAKHFPESLIIGGDQIAECEGRFLGKPGSFEKAVQQLQFVSQKHVTFHNGLCVLHAKSGHAEITEVKYSVYFKKLDRDTIERYLKLEPAFNCAGSFKSEGLGIALCEKFDGEDPTALIGLPLIQLSRMLERAGVKII